MFLIYFFIRIKIAFNLKENYLEVYEPIKYKILITFVLFELFLGFRAVYYYLNFIKGVKDQYRILELCYYSFELLMVVFITFTISINA